MQSHCPTTTTTNDCCQMPISGGSSKGWAQDSGGLETEKKRVQRAPLNQTCQKEEPSIRRGAWRWPDFYCAGSTPLTRPGGKDTAQRRCYCRKLPTGQFVEPKSMFLLANTHGFWFTGALIECWCQRSHSHTECHGWTRPRGAPGAKDLDPGLQDEDRQTGAYF